MRKDDRESNWLFIAQFVTSYLVGSILLIWTLVYLKKLTGWGIFDHSLALIFFPMIYSANIYVHRRFYLLNVAISFFLGVVAILIVDPTPANALALLTYITLIFIIAAESIFQRKNAFQNMEHTNLELQKALAKAHQMTIHANHASKSKSQFLANMSHELRTPLNSIIGFSNILLKNKKNNLTENDLDFINRILSNGKLLLSLVNDILDLSKVEAGRMEVFIESVDLHDLITEITIQIQSQANNKKLRLTSEIPDRVELIHTDRAKLKQILFNLLSNAIKFTEQGSVTIRVSTNSHGHAPERIDVTDTGIGIPSDKLDSIFDVFQQGDYSLSRKYGGTGLGLAISKSMAQLLGYELTVRSEEGHGSTFSVLMDKDWNLEE